MSPGRTAITVMDEARRRALLAADDRAERRMPLKGLAVALVVIAVAWARARWWM